MGLFGLFEDEKKEEKAQPEVKPAEPEKKEEPWFVAPTTGNEYYHNEAPSFELHGGLYLTRGEDNKDKALEDWADMRFPIRTKQAKEMSDNVKDIKEMMSTLVEQNKALQDKVEELENEVEEIKSR